MGHLWLESFLRLHWNFSARFGNTLALHCSVVIGAHAEARPVVRNLRVTDNATQSPKIPDRGRRDRKRDLSARSKGGQRGCRDQSKRTSWRICSETFGVSIRVTSGAWIGSAKSVQAKLISFKSNRVEYGTSPVSDLRPKRNAYCVS